MVSLYCIVLARQNHGAVTQNAGISLARFCLLGFLVVLCLVLCVCICFLIRICSFYIYTRKLELQQLKTTCPEQPRHSSQKEPSELCKPKCQSQRKLLGRKRTWEICFFQLSFQAEFYGCYTGIEVRQRYRTLCYKTLWHTTLTKYPYSYLCFHALPTVAIKFQRGPKKLIPSTCLALQQSYLFLFGFEKTKQLKRNFTERGTKSSINPSEV